MNQTVRDLEHLLHRLIEGRLVGLRGLLKTTQLADKLQRRRADLFMRRRRVEVE